MNRTFTGRTEDATSVFLGADFWKEGTEIRGRVKRRFSVTNERGPQTCYAIETESPVTTPEGEETDRVAINLTGFHMAVQAAGRDPLQVDDHVVVRCTGFTRSKKKGNADRANFEVEITPATVNSDWQPDPVPY